MTKSINLAVILFITLAFSCKEEPTKPPTETNLTLEVLINHVLRFGLM